MRLRRDQPFLPFLSTSSASNAVEWVVNGGCDIPKRVNDKDPFGFSSV
jgi:hypothetical protein